MKTLSLSSLPWLWSLMAITTRASVSSHVPLSPSISSPPSGPSSSAISPASLQSPSTAASWTMDAHITLPPRKTRRGACASKPGFGPIPDFDCHAHALDGSTPGPSTRSPGTPATIALITVDHRSCRAWQYSAAQEALKGLASLAMAGKAAVSAGYRDREGNPAQYLFGRTPSANVIEMFDMVAAYVTQSMMVDQTHEPIRVSCADKGVDKCGSSPDSVKSGFVVEHDNIVLCPLFFLFPPHTTHPPCEGKFTEDGIIGLGATTRAELLMRYVVEAVGFPVINQYASGLRANRALLLAGRRDARAEWNADSYAQTAGWAYNLGMTSGPERNYDCIDRFRPRDFSPGTGEFPRNLDWLYLAFTKPPPLAPDRADTPRAVAALARKMEERQRWLQREWERRREQWGPLSSSARTTLKPRSPA